MFPSRMTRGTIERVGVDSITALTPLGRLGDDGDLKGAAVLFASAAVKHITGQTLAVDGGRSVVWPPSAMRIEDVTMGVNYGLDRVRFPSPVPVGSRVRGHSKLLSFEPIEGGAQVVTEVTVEREGQAKPVCVAQAVSRRYVR